MKIRLLFLFLCISAKAADVPIASVPSDTNVDNLLGTRNGNARLISTVNLPQAFKTNIVSFINNASRSKTNFTDLQMVGGPSYGASNDNAIVLGGMSNRAYGVNSFIGGGVTNQATNYYSTIINGGWGRAWGAFSIIGMSYFTPGGSIGNTALGTLSAIYCGEDNIARGIVSFIGNGNDCHALQIHSTVVNGSQLINNAPYAFMGGGQFNVIGDDTEDPYAPVNPGGLYSVLVGGNNNTIKQTSTNSFIGGGFNNTANSNLNVIPGGFNNTINGSNSQAYGSSLTGENNNTINIGTLNSTKLTVDGTNTVFRGNTYASNAFTSWTFFTNRGVTIIPYRRTGTSMDTESFNVSAGTGITAAMTTNVTHIAVSGGVTVTATPSIVGAVPNQLLIIEGADDVDTVTLQDRNTLANSGLKLNAPTRTLSRGTVLVVLYNSADSLWEELLYTGPFFGNINTNATPPAAPSTIKGWMNVINDSGKVGKIPVYY